MPACAQCRKLVDGRCVAFAEAHALGRPLPPPPPGACMMPIVEDYAPLIQSGMQVLEIGPGSWNAIREMCRRAGAYYEGIDVSREYYGKPTIATRIENLAELSFESERFDLVIGNLTIQLWGMYGCNLRWGLYQCFRVCKFGGRVCMNTAFHVQGTREFLFGDMAAVRAAFAPFSNRVTIEAWGDPTDPLPPYYALPHYWVLAKRPAYCLDIQAIKDRPLPTNITNAGAASGWRARWREYPLSWHCYRALQRLGLRA